MVVEFVSQFGEDTIRYLPLMTLQVIARLVSDALKTIKLSLPASCYRTEFSPDVGTQPPKLDLFKVKRW